MAVYFIADVETIDQVTMERYRAGVSETFRQFGVRVIARGGHAETIEGDWQPKRIVILEFDDAEHFRRWYHSREYQAILPLRESAGTTRAILVEGV